MEERAKPVKEQDGSVECGECGRWFRSRGGLAVHKCYTGNQPQESPLASAEEVLCRECQRKFRRPGDLKKHKCRGEREKPVHEQKGAVQCSKCGRWLRSRGGAALLHTNAKLPETIVNARK